MREILQQLPALLGVVVGVVATFALTSLGERARWRRDQRLRWDSVKLEAYASYSDAVKRVVHFATRLAVTRGLPHSSEAIPFDEGQAELSIAVAERSTRWESVLLLGHPDTVAAARAWHQVMWRLEFYARGVLTDRDGWAAALNEFEQTRKEFYRAARRDLGVQGEISTAPWPPDWYKTLSEDQRALVVFGAETLGLDEPGDAARLTKQRP
ncbi:hypothetical protein GCM10022255_111240 [Dactylosporangium darangshiense]|uniref:Secreted protein n=1 Tax=Dactylosporangium darangshiense TaxID=579108 RepID=A0ABP8DUU8_9ACTN